VTDESPPKRRPNAAIKRARKTAEAQTFVRQIGRTSRREGLDPNDRGASEKSGRAIQQMKPADLDRVLRDDED
jgi:hypothetical protein